MSPSRTGISKRRHRFAKWVSRMLSEGDGTPSTKRVCFLMAITSAIALCFGLFLRHGFEALVVDLAKSTLITAGAAYGITRFAEYGAPVAGIADPGPASPMPATTPTLPQG